MSEKMLSLEDLTQEDIAAPWVLVLGGVSRDGNRRARRAARDAVGEGLNVLWLDGYEETWPGEGTTRVPIDGLEGKGVVVIAGFRRRERSRLLNRLAFGSPKSGHDGHEGDDGAGDGSTSPNGRTITAIGRSLFRKINQVFRGYQLWRILRPTLTWLRNTLPQPASIVYCDDYAVPTGWHAARIWDAPIGMELQES